MYVYISVRKHLAIQMGPLDTFKLFNLRARSAAAVLKFGRFEIAAFEMKPDVAQDLACCHNVSHLPLCIVLMFCARAFSNAGLPEVIGGAVFSLPDGLV
jgi:hypothetical protein